MMTLIIMMMTTIITIIIIIFRVLGLGSSLGNSGSSVVVVIITILHMNPTPGCYAICLCCSDAPHVDELRSAVNEFLGLEVNCSSFQVEDVAVEV